MALFKRRDEKDEEYEEDPSNAYGGQVGGQGKKI